MGVLTSGVNLAAFFVSTELFHINHLISNFSAWVLTVLVAYVANRRYVFRSELNGGMAQLKEFGRFVYSRFLSLLVDMVLMWILVDGFHFPSGFVKLFNSGVVVALNYVISKLLVFKKKTD